MTPVGTVVVLEPGQITTGIWCDTCLLPARISVEVLTLSDAGVQRAGVYEWCQDCGAGKE